MSVSPNNLSYALEHKNEFNRLEAQAKKKGYQIEPEFRHLYLKQGDTLLDAGCGSGHLSRFLAEQNPHARIIGCDASSDRLKQAAEAASPIRNLEFIHSDLAQLAFENETFDVIACRFVFHHLSSTHRVRVIQELHRVLKPGGRIVSADPDGMFYTLCPMPEVVSRALKIIETKDCVDLFAGRKIPHLLLQEGFTSPKFRAETISDDTDLLRSQEIQLMKERFEQLMPFLEHALEDVKLALQFRDAFLNALAFDGAVYYCPKIITTAAKPLIH